jgi:hypothetical protein
MQLVNRAAEEGRGPYYESRSDHRHAVASRPALLFTHARWVSRITRTARAF